MGNAHHHGHHHDHGGQVHDRRGGQVGVVVAEVMAAGALSGALAASLSGHRQARDVYAGWLEPQMVVAAQGGRPQPQAPVPLQLATSAVSARQSTPRDNSWQSPPREPLLSAAVVRVPRGSTDHRGSVTYFAIDVAPDGGRFVWRVMHRYREFHELACRLGHEAFSLQGAPFPRKRMWECAGARLEERRRGLEVWLQQALMYTFRRQDWSPALREFLTDGLRVLPPETPQPQLLDAAAVPTAPLDAAAVPTAPPAAAQEPEEPEAQGSAPDELLQIQVPAGVEPGQLLAVVVPDGRQLMLPVPPGARGGATLQLLLDPATGALSVHSQG